MEAELDIQRGPRFSWPFVVLGFILVYFVFNSFCGDRNVYRYFALKQEINNRKQTAVLIANKKNDLQRKVQHLSDYSLDADLLDERARAVLNMAADDEFIILSSELE